jgi:hypothetical protein
MIYVECKPDSKLVRSITNVSKREIVHESNKFEVCKRLEKCRSCTGLIDEDPLSVQPRYLTKTRLENDLSEHDIKVFYHDSTDNHLIVLRPRLEEWILNAAKEAGIDIGRYNLPNNAAKLHSHINISLDKFEGLLEDLKDSSKRLKTLKRLLEKGY